MKYVIITGADRGIGLALSKKFLSAGYTVFSGRFMPDWPELNQLKKEYPDTLHLINLNVGDEESVRKSREQVGKITARVDFLINCACVFQGDSDQETHNCLNVNAVGTVRMVEEFLPLMKDGEKRLCFFSSEASSISLAHRRGDFSYCVSKACLNMSVKLMFRQLQPQGYRFRLYHPGWVRSYMSGVKNTDGYYEPEETAEVAFVQFTGEDLPEDVLVIRDVCGELWPF